MTRAFADRAVVYVTDPHGLEGAIRRFTKTCRETGLFAELRRRQHYAPPSVARRQKMKRAARRRAAQRRRARAFDGGPP